MDQEQLKEYYYDVTPSAEQVDKVLTDLVEIVKDKTTDGKVVISDFTDVGDGELGNLVAKEATFGGGGDGQCEVDLDKFEVPVGDGKTWMEKSGFYITNSETTYRSYLLSKNYFDIVPLRDTLTLNGIEINDNGTVTEKLSALAEEKHFATSDEDYFAIQSFLYPAFQSNGMFYSPDYVLASMKRPTTDSATLTVEIRLTKDTSFVAGTLYLDKRYSGEGTNYYAIRLYFNMTEINNHGITDFFPYLRVYDGPYAVNHDVNITFLFPSSTYATVYGPMNTGNVTRTQIAYNQTKTKFDYNQVASRICSIGPNHPSNRSLIYIGDAPFNGYSSGTTGITLKDSSNIVMAQNSLAIIEHGTSINLKNATIDMQGNQNNLDKAEGDSPNTNWKGQARWKHTPSKPTIYMSQKGYLSVGEKSAIVTHDGSLIYADCRASLVLLDYTDINISGAPFIHIHGTSNELGVGDNAYIEGTDIPTRQPSIYIEDAAKIVFSGNPTKDPFMFIKGGAGIVFNDEDKCGTGVAPIFLVNEDSFYISGIGSRGATKDYGGQNIGFELNDLKYAMINYPYSSRVNEIAAIKKENDYYGHLKQTGYDSLLKLCPKLGEPFDPFMIDSWTDHGRDNALYLDYSTYWDVFNPWTKENNVQWMPTDFTRSIYGIFQSKELYEQFTKTYLEYDWVLGQMWFLLEDNSKKYLPSGVSESTYFGDSKKRIYYVRSPIGKTTVQDFCKYYRETYNKEVPQYELYNTVRNSFLYEFKGKEDELKRWVEKTGEILLIDNIFNYVQIVKQYLGAENPDSVYRTFLTYISDDKRVKYEEALNKYLQAKGADKIEYYVKDNEDGTYTLRSLWDLALEQYTDSSVQPETFYAANGVQILGGDKGSFTWLKVGGEAGDNTQVHILGSSHVEVKDDSIICVRGKSKKKYPWLESQPKRKLDGSYMNIYDKSTFVMRGRWNMDDSEEENEELKKPEGWSEHPEKIEGAPLVEIIEDAQLKMSGNVRLELTNDGLEFTDNYGTVKITSVQLKKLLSGEITGGGGGGEDIDLLENFGDSKYQW